MQAITTELSDICEKLSDKLNLQPERVGDEIVLQGNTYRISYKAENGREQLRYRDCISQIYIDIEGEDRCLSYTIKAHFVDGRSHTLKKTDLGKVVLAEVMRIAREKQPKNSENHVEFVARTPFYNLERVYELIRSHIFD